MNLVHDYEYIDHLPLCCLVQQLNHYSKFLLPNATPWIVYELFTSTQRAFNCYEVGILIDLYPLIRKSDLLRIKKQDAAPLPL
jgi:hypothetical protein